MDKETLKISTRILLSISLAIMVLIVFVVLFKTIQINYISAFILFIIPIAIYKSIENELKSRPRNKKDRLIKIIIIVAAFLIMPIAVGIIISALLMLIWQPFANSTMIIPFYFVISFTFILFVALKNYNPENGTLIKSSLTMVLSFLTILFTFVYDQDGGYTNLLIGNFIGTLISLSICGCIDYYKEGSNEI